MSHSSYGINIPSNFSFTVTFKVNTNQELAEKAKIDSKNVGNLLE
jgi:hypothetical protein